MNITKSNSPFKELSGPLRIVVIYAIVGGLWILFSDNLLVTLVKDPARLTHIQTFKGWFYVLITAYMLYWLIDRHLREIRLREKELWESEERYRSLIETASDGIILIDQDGRFLFVNNQYPRMLGYTRDELLNKNFADTLPLEEREMGLQSLKEIIKENLHFAIYEGKNIRRDGNLIDVEIRWSITYKDVMAVAQGIVRDVTAQRMMVELLRESEEKFKGISERSLIGIYLIQDGVFRYVNPRLAEIFGYTVEELIDRMGPRDLTLPEDWPVVEENLRKRIDGEVESVHYDFRGIKKDKEIIYVEVYGSRTIYKRRPAVIGTLLDITERRQAEESLRESEKRYKKLVESVTDYIYTVKVENGKAVATSHGPGCVAVTGYAQEEFDADPHLWYRMIFEEDRKAVIEQADRVLLGKIVQPLEHRIVHKDGSIRWVRNTPVPRYDEQGQLVAYDGLITDITELKNLEGQLRHSQKMEAIGTLAGGIAHDFNNIITAIIGYGNILKMKMDKDDPLKIHLDQIIASAERGANLTQQLLAFSRKQIINPRPVRLNEIIKRLEELLMRVIGEDIELRTILTDKDLTVIADSGQIEQVLVNLCTNARDAMPYGGILTISTEPFELDNEFIKTYGYGSPGMYCLISVTDTGIGMDEKTIEKIFDPFFTTKELGKGTGLGLAIVYGIIKQHNGYINCYSRPGEGTTFKIYLPMIKTETEEEKPTPYPVTEIVTETVLIAEDELEVREAIKDALEIFGYRVIDAVDGEDAVNKFIKDKDRIGFLILDVVMPKKSGKEVYDEIKKIRPDIKALFISGYTPNIIHKKGILTEGINFIFKPISPNELLRKMKEVFDKG